MDYLLPPKEFSSMERIYALASRRYQIIKTLESQNLPDDTSLEDVLCELGFISAEAYSALGTDRDKVSGWVVESAKEWIANTKRQQR